MIPALSFATVAAVQQAKPGSAPVSRFEVVRSYPHDPQAFTQGLVFLDGVLYEGTGLNGRSGIRRVRLENGEVVKIQKLEDRYFGEGIAIVGDSIVQLTWKSEVGFVYDRNTFQRTKTFNYPGEGLHDEIELYVKAGLSPQQALASSVLTGPKFLGHAERYGSVAPGKTADLLILDANPLQTVAATRKISAVVLRGRLIDRQALDRLLADTKIRAAPIRLQAETN